MPITSSALWFNRREIAKGDLHWDAKEFDSNDEDLDEFWGRGFNWDFWDPERVEVRPRLEFLRSDPRIAFLEEEFILFCMFYNWEEIDFFFVSDLKLKRIKFLLN